MDLSSLKTYAQKARKDLLSQIEIRLQYVLQKDSLEERENPDAIQKLKTAIEESSKEEVLEKIAYTWFNRFTALRYLDANEYTNVKFLSPAVGETLPEILSQAKQGIFSSSFLIDEKRKKTIQTLLNGTLKSNDPESEAYKLLLTSACNTWSAKMPFFLKRSRTSQKFFCPQIYSPVIRFGQVQ
jgi:hypothetical protein